MNTTQRLAIPAIILFSILLYGCNWMKPSVKVPDLPLLTGNKVNPFKVSDRFILSESSNSCCMYCYMADSTLSEQIPASPLLKFIETIEDPADSDCDGCSSYYYHVFECISTGTDTLNYYVIPMGAVHGAADCGNLNEDTLKEQILKNDASPVTYIISVHD